MKTVTKARRKLGGDWNINEDCTTHWVDPRTSAYTLCGVRVGPEAKGWIETYWNGAADCKRCIKVEEVNG